MILKFVVPFATFLKERKVFLEHDNPAVVRREEKSMSFALPSSPVVLQQHNKPAQQTKSKAAAPQKREKSAKMPLVRRPLRHQTLKKQFR